MARYVDGIVQAGGEDLVLDGSRRERSPARGAGGRADECLWPRGCADRVLDPARDRSGGLRRREGREGGEDAAACQPERMDAARANLLRALRAQHVPRRRVGRWPGGPVDIRPQCARRRAVGPCHEGRRRPTRDPREQAPRRLLHVAHALHDPVRRREPLAGRKGRRGQGRRRGRARPGSRAGDLPLARRPVPAADEPHEPQGLLRQRQRQGPLRHPDRPRELPDGSDSRAGAGRGLRQPHVRGRRLQPLLPQPALRAADRVRPHLRRLVRRGESRPQREADLRLRRVVRPDPPPAARCGHLGQGARHPLGRQRGRHRSHHGMERHPPVAATRELHLAGHAGEPTSAAAPSSPLAPTCGGTPPR